MGPKRGFSGFWVPGPMGPMGPAPLPYCPTVGLRCGVAVSAAIYPWSWALETLGPTSSEVGLHERRSSAHHSREGAHSVWLLGPTGSLLGMNRGPGPLVGQGPGPGGPNGPTPISTPRGSFGAVRHTVGFVSAS